MARVLLAARYVAGLWIHGGRPSCKGSRIQRAARNRGRRRATSSAFHAQVVAGLCGLKSGGRRECGGHALGGAADGSGGSVRGTAIDNRWPRCRSGAYHSNARSKRLEDRFRGGADVGESGLSVKQVLLLSGFESRPPHFLL